MAPGSQANCPTPAELADRSPVQTYHFAAMLNFDLKRSLSWRISFVALALLLGAALLTMEYASRQMEASLNQTGNAMVHLITGELGRRHPEFDRRLTLEDLDPVEDIGRLGHVCALLQNIYLVKVGPRCFSEDAESWGPVRDFLAWRLRDLHFVGELDQAPGLKFGKLHVMPNGAAVAAEVSRQLLILLAVLTGLFAMAVLVYRRVAGALQPTNTILDALARMEKGELSVRLPGFPLIELQRISTVFNHMADRMEAAALEQQRLCQRLLEVREEERRHLARELHDEFGQHLVALQLEAAYAEEVARESLPELEPCTRSLGLTAERLMESLQAMVRQLRPFALEEFGLKTSLEMLITHWSERSGLDCHFKLHIEGDLEPLSDDLSTHLYRIVQESITNATRHGRASQVTVSLAVAPVARCIRLQIEDDGEFPAATPPPAGFGLLNMGERVRALSGNLSLLPRHPRGLRVEVSVPLPEPGP